jgi:hypothetical protein
MERERFRVQGTMAQSEVDSMTAIAHLPGLDIEIVHRHSPDGLTEQVSINLKAVPSFEAFARSIDALNPFAFWAEAMRLVWFPWIEATRAVMMAPSLSPSPAKARPERPGHPGGGLLIRETD